MSFLRDTVKSAGAALALTGARFAALAIIARKLDVELFGTLAFSIFCLDLLVLTCLMGLPAVISRYLPIATSQDRAVLRALQRKWFLASLGIITGAAPLIASLVVDLSGIALWLFTAWALLTAAQATTQSIMLGAFRYDLFAWSSGLGAAVLMAGAIFLVTEGTLLNGMAVLTLAPAVQMIPMIAMIGKPPIPKPNSSGLPDRSTMLSYGANAWVTALTAALVWSRGELLVVESMLDDRALGLYGAAITLTALVWRLTGLMQGAVAPHLATRMQDREGLTVFVRDISRLTMMVSAAFALAIALLGREIATLMFGAEFAEAGDLMAYLAPGAAMAGIGTVNLCVQYLSNAVVTRNALIVASFALPALSAVLIIWLGADGAATGRSLTLIPLAATMAGWMMLRGYRALGHAVLIELLVIGMLVAAASVIALGGFLPLPGRILLCLAGWYALGYWATGATLPHRMIRGAVAKLGAH